MSPDPEPQQELADIRQRLSQLRQQVVQLDERTLRLEQQLTLARTGFVTGAAAAPAKAPRPAVPPPLPVAAPAVHPATTPAAPRLAAMAQPPEAPAPARIAVPPTLTPMQPMASPVLVAPAPNAGASSAAPSRGEASFEMRLGTYWLVRVGIVMVLTAMVFFGKYAYQNLIAPMGPAGKVALLYLAGGALLGLGAWLERGRESLRNYGQVLFAGGLAAVYFTTYGAHHLPALQVITSPLLDGILLLAWTGFMVWLADRRKSELLGLFGVGLAFYASAMTQVGYFTLYSNLLLTLAAVWFLVRNRWASLSLVSLLAAYASYLFWRFHGADGWRWDGPNYALWSGGIFLIGYWIVFTAAVFLSTHERLAGASRQLFLTANNAAFFALFLLTLLQARSEGFSNLCFGFGGVLLGAAVAAQTRLRHEPWTGYLYLIQGLVLVAAGCFNRYSGPTLGILFAAESVVLLTLGDRLKHPILRSSAIVSGILGAFAAVLGMKGGTFTDALPVVGAAGFLLFNAWWRGGREQAPWALAARPVPAAFTTLGLFVGAAATWHYLDPAYRAPVFAAEAVLLTFTLRWVRVPEFVLVGQPLLVLGSLLWLGPALAHHPPQPEWIGPVLVGLTLCQAHWWQRQPLLRLETVTRSTAELLCGLLFVGLLHAWCKPYFTADTWLPMLSALAISVTVYGAVTRAWMLALTGQAFAALAGVAFVQGLSQGHPDWAYALAPIACIFGLGLGTQLHLSAHPNAAGDARTPLLQAASLYRWIALALAWGWIQEYVPFAERQWVLTAFGLALFAWGSWRSSPENLAAATVLAAAGLGQFWLRTDPQTAVYAPNLLAVLALGAMQSVARRLPGCRSLPPAWYQAIIVATGLTLWRWLSLWIVDVSPGGFYLTATWALFSFAAFLAGILLAERAWRWFGLGVLALALARVVALDVWKLEIIYRVVSFLALGLVLLALGFIYNRFQERIRQLL